MRGVVKLLFVAYSMVMVGSMNGQSADQRTVEFIKYPILGSEDATGESHSPEDRELLNDFYQSKVEQQLHEAVVANDAEKLGPLLADQISWIAERFGKGVTLTKAQVLDDFRSGNLHVNTQAHNHVRIVVVGRATVVVTGLSYSTLIYQAKNSRGPRMFAEVWVKLAGRWQMVAHHVSDVKKM